MRKTAVIVFTILLLSGCVHKKAAMKNGEGPFVDRYMKNVTQLTFDGDNGEAYFSRDDSKLIYQSNRSGYACDKIWVMNTDGSDKRRVSPDHGANTCSFFFPDIQKIVFASTSHLPGDCPLRPDMPQGASYVWPLYPYDIFLANADGSGLKKITDNPKYDAEPIVSSDGKQIVFGSQRDGDFDIYIMDADGRHVRRLTERVGYDGGPWFSPDGKKIVWRAWHPETEKELTLWRDCMENDYIVPFPLDIRVMDVDGSNKARLTQNGATNWSPSWYPDGKRIIFSSNMDDWREDIQKFGHNFELYLINIDGTGLERITFNSVFDSFPMFSHDGKKVVFASNRNPLKPRATDIYIADWTDFPQGFSKEQMMEVIRFLSSDDLRGRGFGTEGLDRAAEFIAGKFQEAGLVPAGDEKMSYFQIWEDKDGDSEHKVIMKNVIGVIPGKRPELKSQSIVVGAHYDHLGLGRLQIREEKHRGKIHPGADDNASGVAVIIELAQVLGKGLKPDRSVVFVAFTGEEAGRKGSKYYVANHKRYPPDQCIGMLNIDTVGRLGEKKLLVLGTGSAREWVHIFRGAGYVTGVDVEVVSGELDSSDQKSFQDAGLPAVQLFSGPHLECHRPTDTVDKIDPDGLLKVASVAKEVVEYLAGREEPMTTTSKPGGDIESTPKRERKVSLGTIPDFAFSGVGYKLAGVVPRSPAESFGLQEGDVIVRIGSDAVNNLRDLSNILKSLNPSDRISITFLREEKKMTVEAVVKGK